LLKTNLAIQRRFRLCSLLCLPTASVSGKGGLGGKKPKVNPPKGAESLEGRRSPPLSAARGVGPLLPTQAFAFEKNASSKKQNLCCKTKLEKNKIDRFDYGTNLFCHDVDQIILSPKTSLSLNLKTYRIGFDSFTDFLYFFLANSM
jgi:hypothetical protein